MSPHLSSFRERVQVDAELLPEDAMMTHLPKILERCVALAIPATFFEITFLLACLHYAESKCDAVVLEVIHGLFGPFKLDKVGLGGELDATNVVATSISIICSVCKCPVGSSLLTRYSSGSHTCAGRHCGRDLPQEGRDIQEGSALPRGSAGAYGRRGGSCCRAREPALHCGAGLGVSR